MKLTVLRLIVVAFACLCAIVVVSNRRAPQASTNQSEFAALYSSTGIPIPVQTPAAGLQEKTVAQAGLQKNIKVLGDLPESQLFPVMLYFAASMGRNCDICHVNNNGQWDFTADTKPEKNTAREMIKMVLDTNKNFFKGNTEVGCYTCHRGRTSPQGVPTLPLPIPSPPTNQGAPRPGGIAPGGAATPGQPQASPSPRPSPPSGDEIINKYITAIGGQAAIDKIKTRTMKGSMVAANGQTLTYEIDQVAPDKAYDIFTSRAGTMERGINGDLGWVKNPQGVQEITGQQLTGLRASLQIFRNLKLKEQYPRMRFGGRDKVGDRDAIILNVATAENRPERLYFDVETGLLLRRITVLQTIVGIIPEQTDFQDYREVDGLKLPFIILLASVNNSNPISTFKFDEIKLNLAIDDSKFKMPAAKAGPNP
jgi:photosynthetic reaction center cytochrome c subunit